MYTDERVRTRLFAYLYQVNDWYGTPQKACKASNNQQDKAYLSHCQTYKNQIQGFLHEHTDLYARVSLRISETLEANELETMPILEFFKRMVPNH